jgi:hypothetical protein
MKPKCSYSQCKTILSIYNKSKYCHAHLFKVEEERYKKDLLDERNQKLRKLKLIQLTKWQPLKKDLNGAISVLEKYKVKFKVVDRGKTKLIGQYAIFKKPDLYKCED